MNRDDPDHEQAAVELAAIEFRSPGRFAVNNSPVAVRHSAQPPAAIAPAPFILNESGATQRFDTADQALSHLLAMLTQARRSLSLYSLDFEPWLYNHRSVEQACTRFILEHPRNRLRVLLGDASRAVKQGHRLLQLARRLSSNMQIRKCHPEYSVQPDAFLVVDSCALIVRPEPDTFTGQTLYRDPGLARQVQRRFDLAWDHSLSDPDLRSFLL